MKADLDYGTPELQEKRELYNQTMRSGVEYLFNRKTITKRQAVMGLTYRGWFEARYRHNETRSVLSNLIPSEPNAEVPEFRYIDIMAGEDWYRKVSDELTKRGIQRGMWFYDAMRMVAIESRTIDDYRQWLHTKGVKIGSDTATRWVKRAFTELCEIVEDIKAEYERGEKSSCTIQGEM